MKPKMLLLNVLVFTLTLLPAGMHAVGKPAALAGVAAYQETHRLVCQGQFWGYQATITGWRQYSPYNALGDGEVRFQGEMQIGRDRLPMAYEGYTATEFKGFLRIGRQSYYFKILDNTGGRMIIYEGRERLTAPDTWGEFVCRWHRWS